jgi:phosphorylcholine metabolism protein LicD
MKYVYTGPEFFFFGGGEKTPCKNWLITVLNKVIYNIYRNNFAKIYKASLHCTKQGGDQLKKSSLFSNMLLLARVTR